MNRINLNGQIVKIKPEVLHPQDKNFGGSEYRVEGYWDELTGKSWMHSDENPACLVYAVRSAFADLPMDDNVLYGKVGQFGHLVHISEIEIPENKSVGWSNW